MKKQLMKLVAKSLKRIAESSSDTTSLLILYQPQKPKMLIKPDMKKRKEVS